MSDLIDRYQNLLKTGFEYAEQDKASAQTSNFEIYMGHFAGLFSEIHTAISEVNDRVKNARREALEEAARYHEYLAKMLRGSQREKSHLGYASDLRALIPSEPHDAEGRENPRRGDPSIFDDAEGRN